MLCAKASWLQIASVLGTSHGHNAVFQALRGAYGIACCMQGASVPDTWIEDPCDGGWAGVTCKDHSVTVIRFESFGLQGTAQHYGEHANLYTESSAVLCRQCSASQYDLQQERC